MISRIPQVISGLDFFKVSRRFSKSFPPKILRNSMRFCRRYHGSNPQHADRIFKECLYFCPTIRVVGDNIVS